MRHFTIHQTLSFGHYYRCPKQRYVFCPIMVGIKHRIAVITSKLFPLSIANVETVRTSFTRIGRRNRNQFNAIQQTFIGKKLTELVKTPFAYSCSKFLAFLICRKSNTFQILNSNSFAFEFSNLNNLFTDSMIGNCAKSSFTTRKPFQKSFSRLRAFSLNRTPNLLSFFSIFLKWFRIKGLAITQCANIYKPEIATDKTFNIFNIFFWNFNSLEKVKLTLLKNQIRFAFYVRNVFLIVADKFYPFQSAIHRPQRNAIFTIRKYASIVGDCTKLTKLSLNFPVKFVGIANLRNATDNHLSRKIEATFYSVISFVMEFILIVNFLCKSGVRNFIAGSIRLNQRFFERGKLLMCWQEFYLQCQFHNAKIQNNFIYLTNYLITKGERQFLQAAKDRLVSLPKIL